MAKYVHDAGGNLIAQDFNDDGAEIAALVVEDDRWEPDPDKVDGAGNPKPGVINQLRRVVDKTRTGGDAIAFKGWTLLEDRPVADGVNFRWSVEAKDVVEIVKPPAPPAKRDVPTVRFLLAFTAAELKSVRASESDEVQRLLFALSLTPVIDMVGATTLQGIQLLNALGLLSDERASEILATK